MPLHWTIDHDKRLVLVTAHGRLTDADMRAYLHRLAAAGVMSYAKIFDGSTGRSFLKADQLEALGRWLQDYMKAPRAEVGPLAIVVGSTEHLLQAEFFADAAAGPRPVRVFRDLADARAWIRDLSGS